MTFNTAVADQLRPQNPDGIGAEKFRSLTLRGARVAIDARSALRAEVEIQNGLIQAISHCPEVARGSSIPSRAAVEIDLTGYLLLPGLINAHEHLEFSLFPKLGRGPYKNAEQWARDIYHPESSPIREHLNVPKPVRLWWGGIRNLLCGVTTVCHHNEFQPDVFDDRFPVRVVRRYAWSHSLQFGGDLESAFRASNSETPYIIHLGEGTDTESTAEIFELDRRKMLGPRTVIVHGVALDDAGHDLVIRRGAALIWCPESNLFTLGVTLSPRRIEVNPRSALASDSALTAGDLLDQVRIAHSLGCPAEQIFDLVTTRAADGLRLQNVEGRLAVGAIADLIAILDSGLSPAATLVQASTDKIELVLSAGLPYLLSNHMVSRFPGEIEETMNSIVVDGSRRLIHAPVTQLLQETVKQLGGVPRLTGKPVWQ